MMPQVCFGATISWALMFSGVHDDARQIIQPICFSELWLCRIGESSANFAFAYDGNFHSHKAVCIEQPANTTGK